MTGRQVCAALLATGRIFGVGIGSPLPEVDRAFAGEYIEELGEDGADARRDYGLIEVSLANMASEWVVAGIILELHRLPGNGDLLREARKDIGVCLPEYMSWVELRHAALAAMPGVSLQVAQQGDYLEYRNVDANVSVAVVNDRTERGEWPGHGDVWSISIG